MAAHRYWRISQFDCTDHGDYFRLYEIDFRTVAGTPRGFFGGTFSSNYNTADAYKAADGNLTTWWGGGYYFQNPEYWVYDYGAGNACDIVEVCIKTGASGYAKTANHFWLEWSDDNTTWTIAMGWWPAVWTANATQTFNVNPSQPADSPSAGTTFNPVGVGAGITLSNGNLTATKKAGSGIARSTTAHSAGKLYFEAIISTAINLPLVAIGAIGMVPGVLGAYISVMGNGGIDNIYQNITGAWASTWGRFCVDFTTMTFQFRRNNTDAWIPFSLAASKGQSLEIAVDLGGANNNDYAILNTGGSAFNGPIPSGFTAWDSPAALSTGRAQAVIMA